MSTSPTQQPTTAWSAPTLVSSLMPTFSIESWKTRASLSAYCVFLFLIMLGPALVPAWLPMRTHLIAGGTLVMFFYNLIVDDDEQLDPTTGTIIGVAALVQQVSVVLNIPMDPQQQPEEISNKSASEETHQNKDSTLTTLVLHNAKFLALAFFLKNALSYLPPTSPLSLLLSLPSLLSNTYILPLIAVPLEFCLQTSTSLPTPPFRTLASLIQTLLTTITSTLLQMSHKIKTDLSARISHLATTRPFRRSRRSRIRF